VGSRMAGGGRAGAGGQRRRAATPHGGGDDVLPHSVPAAAGGAVGCAARRSKVFVGLNCRAGARAARVEALPVSASPRVGSAVLCLSHPTPHRPPPAPRSRSRGMNKHGGVKPGTVKDWLESRRSLPPTPPGGSGPERRRGALTAGGSGQRRRDGARWREAPPLTLVPGPEGGDGLKAPPTAARAPSRGLWRGACNRRVGRLDRDERKRKTNRLRGCFGRRAREAACFMQALHMCWTKAVELFGGLPWD
jgi:hypothetical protein